MKSPFALRRRLALPVFTLFALGFMLSCGKPIEELEEEDPGSVEEELPSTEPSVRPTHPGDPFTRPPTTPSVEPGTVPPSSESERVSPLWVCRSEKPEDGVYVVVRKVERTLELFYEVEVRRGQGASTTIRAKDGIEGWSRPRELVMCGTVTAGQSSIVRVSTQPEPSPSPSPTPIPSPSPTPSASPSPTPSTIPSSTPSPRPSPGLSPMVTVLASPSPEPRNPIFLGQLYEGENPNVRCDLLEELLRLQRWESKKTPLVCVPTPTTRPSPSPSTPRTRWLN